MLYSVTFIKKINDVSATDVFLGMNKFFKTAEAATGGVP